MDQLKIIWANIVKYHFWILTPLVLLASLGAFYVSRAALDEKVKTRISKLESDFRLTSTLNVQAPNHPNAFSDKEMDGMLNTVTMNVKDAWSKQYERQKLILTWNANVIRSKEVLTRLDSYRPIEQFLDYPLKVEPLQVSDRDQYKFYIKNAFPDLAKIIGAKWSAQIGNVAAGASDSGEGSGGATEGEGTTTSSGPAPLVKWESSSQSALQASIVPWYNPNSSPSTLDICYTQEDIWILQGILQVIKATNGNAKENFQAPIKEVEWIKIGKAAGSDVSAMLPGAGGEDGSGDYSGGGMATAAVSPDPADNRYVDSNYKPVPSAKLRAATKSSNPEDAFFAVAKRVPVRFRVKMDQAKIAKLLAECGNGDLMIEVKQVSINAEGGGISIGGGMQGFGGAMSMDDGSGGGSGDDGGGGGGGFDTSQTTSTQASKPDPPLEVYGIVYLFNPVNFSKLGLDKVTENTTLVTTATPTASAASPIPAVADAPAPVAEIPAAPSVPSAPAQPIPGAQPESTPTPGPES